MKQLPLLFLAVQLVSHHAIADDVIKWGQPMNGLRIGVESPAASITSDQEPVFVVTAQNVSGQSIIIPTPDTFLKKTNPDSEDYHELPLIPFIRETNSKPVNPTLPYPDPRYSISENGKPLKEAAAHVVTLAAGQSTTWNEIPLEKHYYVGDRLPPGDKTTILHWDLLPGGQYDIQFQFNNEQARVAGVNVWTGKVESGAAHLQVSPPSAKGVKLQGLFSLAKQSYFLGEPIEVTFTVTNKGDSPIEFPTGGEYRDTGRDGRFTITAVDASGHPVPDPVKPSGFGGGLGSAATVKPGESYSERLLMNHWCAFPGQGKYAVTCKRTLNVVPSDQRKSDFYFLPDIKLPAIPIETALNITIENDPAALVAYLSSLPPSDYEQWECLALAQNPSAFPFIVKLLDGLPEVQAMSVGWLSFYPSDKVSPILIEHFSHLSVQARQSALFHLSDSNAPGVEPLIATALRDKDDELRANAVRLCWNKSYATCTPILLMMQSDPEPLVRRYLGEALGASADRRAIPVLLKLLHDPDLEARVWAAGGLGKFKRVDGVPVMIDLLRNPKMRDYEGNIMDCLQGLTGKDFNDNHSTWLQWWEKIGRTEYGKH